MAPSMVVLVAVNLLLEQSLLTSGFTHWVVTEDGRVQSQADSVFNLRRPYDLVEFMKQEERATTINILKKELQIRKHEIDKNEDRDTGLEQRFYKTDPNCVEAGKPLPEFDLYISTVLPLENKGIRPDEHIEVNANLPETPMAPVCLDVTDLNYSIHAFEHLEGLKDRQNLSGTPELGLKNAITHRENVDDYGHLVYEALQKNKTSWVLYNMAAFYWRIKGDPYHSIECVRRALHYSPRSQKDVALISLANVLHRARYSNEAAIIVHAALDVSKELNVNHFTLGNIYAVLGEYNKSVICFENTLKIQPDFEAAAKRKHAVLCHSKLEAALEAQHRSLQKTLKELKEYQRKHDHWQTQQDKLDFEQVSPEVKAAQQIAYETQKIKVMPSEIGEYCRMELRDGKQVLVCSWSKRRGPLDFDSHSSKMKEGEKGSDYIQKRGKKQVDYSKPVRPPMYSKNKVPPPKTNMEHMIEEWPQKEECDTYVQKVPDPRNLTTTYLSPENKGFEVKALLTEAQNLKPGGEHPLPWYPPVCVPLLEIPDVNRRTYDHLKSMAYSEKSKIPLKYNDPSMRPILLAHVNNPIVTEEEVGQRILTALKENIGPGWVLYNLAGMYWRIIGNNYHGIECIRRSLHLVPDEYRDVPLVNLANIFYRYGRYDDAVTVLRDALSVNDWEPSTHFFFGNVLWATNNYTGAVWHYRRALEGHPDNVEAFNTLRAIRCHQKYHQATQSAAPQELPAQPVGSNCQPKVFTTNQQAESRVICKLENGEEKCIIETRTRHKSSDCNGHCTQTCTISPVKMDTCSGGGEVTVDQTGLNHRLHIHCRLVKNKKLKNSGGSQCAQKGGNSQCSGDNEDILFSGDFTSRLDEVSEYYEKKGLCQGEECNQLRVQCLIPMKTHSGLLAHVITPPKLFVRPVSLHTTQCMQGGQKPHIKLEFVDGVLHQKLIFVQAASDLHVEANECVIFNDGSKSSGCNQPEYRAYILEVDTVKLEQDVEALEKLVSQHLKSCRRIEDALAASSEEEYDINNVPAPPGGPLGYQGPQVDDCLPLPDMELPDTSIHAKSGYDVDFDPVICSSIREVDFRQFTSTWLSVTAKGIDLSDHLDFEMVIKDTVDEPECRGKMASSVIGFDHLPGVKCRAGLDYSGELGLRDVLQRLGGNDEPVQVVGARIAHALKENATSWVLANLAALYWRVEGEAPRAINCLRLALTYAPREYRDTALISMANVMHQTDNLNDAIVITNMALETSANLAVSHFTLANLYAAKEQWDHAVLFYKSTLSLQSHFKPARDRLNYILCKAYA
ncbi:tetratricopeptide repeat protein 17-like isoform X1 [Haliotis rufescens]|uniref:tetratricopeptide repeat protein 17-like isoform X1 n=1 Tax=Haliotis rufescens TaxID=6454 RepID=UPI00201EE721|nr:tetratricopeptide repeat protein 17-like isoform X1 [Haliotis rufescens]